MYIGNEKTRKLWSELKPWMNGAMMKPDAPEEVKAKFEELRRLMDAIEENLISMM